MAVDGFAEAYERFQKAVEIDPDYALAYVLLAEVIPANARTLGLQQSEWMELADKNISKALDLDPLLPEVLFQTALAVDFASGRKAAIPYFDRYLALRGVRFYEHTTTEEGDLDAALQYALFRVADFSATGPRRR